MELFSSNFKKILIFSQKKAFFIFLEMEPCTFPTKLEKNKNSPRENSLYFNIKKFLIFQETETPKKNLIFQETENLKNF